MLWAGSSQELLGHPVLAPSASGSRGSHHNPIQTSNVASILRIHLADSGSKISRWLHRVTLVDVRCVYWEFSADANHSRYSHITSDGNGIHDRAGRLDATKVWFTKDWIWVRCAPVGLFPTVLPS